MLAWQEAARLGLLGKAAGLLPGQGEEQGRPSQATSGPSHMKNPEWRTVHVLFMADAQRSITGSCHPAWHCLYHPAMSRYFGLELASRPPPDPHPGPLSPPPPRAGGCSSGGLEAAGGRSSSHWVNKPTENRATVGLAPGQVQPLRQVCVGWGGSMGLVFTGDRTWCLQSSSGSWGLSIGAGRGTPLSPRDGGSSPPPPKSRALLRRRIHSCGYIEQMGQDKGEPLEQVFPYQGHVQQRS